MAFLEAGCSSTEIQLLAIESDMCVLTENENTSVAIRQGNGDYTVHSDDEHVALAGFCRAGKCPGNVVLTGVAGGQTWVDVTDNLTGKRSRIKVVVVSPADDLAGL